MKGLQLLVSTSVLQIDLWVVTGGQLRFLQSHSGGRCMIQKSALLRNRWERWDECGVCSGESAEHEDSFIAAIWPTCPRISVHGHQGAAWILWCPVVIHLTLQWLIKLCLPSFLTKHDSMTAWQWKLFSFESAVHHLQLLHALPALKWSWCRCTRGTQRGTQLCDNISQLQPQDCNLDFKTSWQMKV